MCVILDMLRDAVEPEHVQKSKNMSTHVGLILMDFVLSLPHPPTLLLTFAFYVTVTSSMLRLVDDLVLMINSTPHPVCINGLAIDKHPKYQIKVPIFYLCKNINLVLQVDMKGAEDINNLKSYLRLLEGIVDVHVSPSNGVIRVEFDSACVGVRHILKTIEVQLHF